MFQNLNKDWPVCEGTAPSPTGVKYLFVEGLPSSPSLVPRNRGWKASCRPLLSKDRQIEGGGAGLVYPGLLTLVYSLSRQEVVSYFCSLKQAVTVTLACEM